MAKKERLRMAHTSAREEASDKQPEPTQPPADETYQNAGDLSALVEQARAGDHAAFEALVTRFQTPVRLYLAHLIGDDEQARDLTQDVFWQAWTGLPKLRDTMYFRAWLFRVATNRGRSWLRHRRLINWVSLDWLNGASENRTINRERAALPGDALHAPESGFEERLAEIETLRQALRQVPVEYRSCLLLHLSLGFTVPEVADQLSLTTGAVRMRLFRGLALLRQTFKQESVSGSG
ncbi:MAG TPA: sigma-70 family RNA polymerase sigma factor [Ktedonobacterales bacterium]|jgi:RNA polymerase sigma-70 factor (ECF subfamily)